MRHRTKREPAIQLRLGKRLDVTKPREPVEHVTSGKTYRLFGSLAPPGGLRPIGLASEARSTVRIKVVALGCHPAE
jgi:hypothetical protein